MPLHLRAVSVGLTGILAMSGCRAPAAEGCYAFDWSHDPPDSSYEEAVRFDSVYLTRKPLPNEADDTARSDRFRVVTALESPDTATIALGNIVYPRSIRWYFLFTSASWERFGRDSVSITLSHPMGHHRVIKGQVTPTGLVGVSRTYDHYRPGDYGQGTEEIFTLIDSSSFTAHRIACPSRIHVFPAGWPR